MSDEFVGRLDVLGIQVYRFYQDNRQVDGWCLDLVEPDFKAHVDQPMLYVPDVAHSSMFSVSYM